ncbi:amidohydrolase family protein, partial [candidate division KSB1 bacterium]
IIMHLKILFICLFLIPLFFNCSQEYDIILLDGKIYDGSGKEPYLSNIAIKDGKIRKVGDVGNNARTVISAENLIISPGFIDIHTHCDNSITSEAKRDAVNYLKQGVTTIVTGNCGNGTYNVKEFFEKIDSAGAGPNIMHLVGHATLRNASMEENDRAPTEDEMRNMKSLLSKAMEEGALGLSTGLFYSPGSFSETEEIIELAGTLKSYSGIYATHLRDESSYNIGLIESVKEAIRIGEEAGVPVEISHIKALGKPVWGKAEEVSSLIEEAQARGLKIYADQYPYNASSTGLSAAVIPRWVQADRKMRERLSDSSLIAQIKKEISENIDRRGGPETLVIVSYSRNHDFDGKSLLEISRTLNKTVVDTAIDLVLNGSPSIISFNMQDSDINYFIKKPYVMTGSDGNIPTFGNGKPHPRSYGTFPRKIRKYVIEENVISMEQAIRAATYLPAQMLGLKDRGLIKEDYKADIVMFDPEKITDTAVFEEPHQYSEGIEFLIINGTIVIENGEYNGKLAGKAIRK